MFSTHRRALAGRTTHFRALAGRTLLPVSLLLTGVLVSGCSGGSGAASGGEASSDSSPTADSAFDQALAFAACMRAEGVPAFPDPQQADGGVRMEAGGVDTDSPEFQGAMEACRDKAPQAEGQGQGGEPLDPAKVAAWARCIRDNGVPDFPDPEINGGQMALDFGGAGLSMADPAFQQARSACQDAWPGGGMMIQGGGGQ
ncbi:MULTISPECIES: hypothetical protein [unclassified Streptomyces]|uniref:hypothetical protein n=1 Tax=unclassified Streptomyces TaxID=2593676 RepID=UPI0034333B1F